MKFFLQDSSTAKFMRCDSMWTADIHEALDFLSVQRAFFHGMKELKGQFQVAQMELSGLSSPVTIVVPQPPWPRVQVQPVQPDVFREPVAQPQNLRRRPARGLAIVPALTPARFLRAAC